MEKPTLRTSWWFSGMQNLIYSKHSAPPVTFLLWYSHICNEKERLLQKKRLGPVVLTRRLRCVCANFDRMLHYWASQACCTGVAWSTKLCWWPYLHWTNRRTLSLSISCLPICMQQKYVLKLCLIGFTSCWAYLFIVNGWQLCLCSSETETLSTSTLSTPFLCLRHKTSLAKAMLFRL